MFASFEARGHLLAFGGSRTYHRLVCAIEDSGFEIRDQIMWIYGSGYPKSKGLLKPAHEPICVARKKGKGVLNINDCRVEPCARWPANIIHDGSDEVVNAFPLAPGQFADASTNAEQRKTQNVYDAMRRGRSGEASANSENEGAVGFKMKPGVRRLDSGSAARFFYCAKASSKDRHEGLGNPGAQFKHGAMLRQVENADTKGNNHPTVKPTELMRYLCRLVTPAGGVVLDPFAGSGSTGKAAILEGFGFIGIEVNQDYIAIAERRIEAAKAAVEEAA
jgi:hypothetical protein